MSRRREQTSSYWSDNIEILLIAKWLRSAPECIDCILMGAECVTQREGNEGLGWRCASEPCMRDGSEHHMTATMVNRAAAGLFVFMFVWCMLSFYVILAWAYGFVGLKAYYGCALECMQRHASTLVQ